MALNREHIPDNASNDLWIGVGETDCLSVIIHFVETGRSVEGQTLWLWISLGLRARPFEWGSVVAIIRAKATKLGRTIEYSQTKIVRDWRHLYFEPPRIITSQKLSRPKPLTYAWLIHTTLSIRSNCSTAFDEIWHGDW